jgi:hypothetical protein
LSETCRFSISPRSRLRLRPARYAALIMTLRIAEWAIGLAVPFAALLRKSGDSSSAPTQRQRSGGGGPPQRWWRRDGLCLLILRWPRSGPRRMRPRRSGPRPSRLGAMRRAPQGDVTVHRSRGTFGPESCALPRQKRFASGNQREAERREAHCPTNVRANRAACALPCGGAPAFRRSRLRRSPPATTPMAQPQNRVSRSLELAGVLPAYILAFS